MGRCQWRNSCKIHYIKESEGAQDGDKGERERELKSDKGGMNGERKHKAMLRFRHMLFPDLLKFIILSLLSHTRDPFPASIILRTEPIPLFAPKLHCFLSPVRVVAAHTRCSSFHAAAATTAADKHLGLPSPRPYFIPRRLLCFDLSPCSDQKYTGAGVTRRSGLFLRS